MESLVNKSETYLMTGGSGLLGSFLTKEFKEIPLLYPTSTEMDITNQTDVENFFYQHQDITTVIHTAAYTNVQKAETEFLRCHRTNVLGTFNVLKQCVQRDIKLIYISTDAVFDGKKGNYKTTDALNPLSKYAKSKTAAELMVRTYDNSLIIRTSFFGKKFPYLKAYIDQWSSKDYIDIIAPKIYRKIVSGSTGIVHIGSPRRSLYEIATSRQKDIFPCSVKENKNTYKIPIDLSLNKE